MIKISKGSIDKMWARQWARLRIDKEGNIRNADGIKVNPDHPIGERRGQKELFIEYEWTFGRGRAKNKTHRIGDNQIVDDYRKVRDRYVDVVYSPNASHREIQEVRKEIIAFRRKHSELYEERKPL